MPNFTTVETEEYSHIEPFEHAVFRYMNRARDSRALHTLNWDGILSYVARLHSKNMSKENFFAHKGPNGHNPGERISEFGYDCTDSYAQNIFRINDFNSIHGGDIGKIGKEAVKWWKNSPKHRAAMYSEATEVAGVGCFVNADNDVYVTCNFCTHDPADVEDAGTGTPPDDCYYGGMDP
jgi:uncharacterized protein YkwD